MSFCINSYRNQGGTSGVLTETGNTMQIESRDSQVLVFHKAECLKGETSFLSYPVPVEPCLSITITPKENNSYHYTGELKCLFNCFLSFHFVK